MSRKSKKRAKQAIPEEILAEGSGPHGQAPDDVVDADAQSLADAAADALASAEIAEVEAEVEAVAMAAEVVVVAAEAARAEEREQKKAQKKGKRGRKADVTPEPEVKLDAWGQPIIVEDEPPPADPEPAAEPEVEAAADSAEDEPVADQAESMSADAGEPVEGAELEAADGEPAEGEELEAADGEPVEGEVLEAAGGEASDADGAALPTSAASMDAAQLKNLVEALVFAADKPVTIQRLRQLTRVSDVRRLEAALAELAEDYKARGIALQVVSGGYQFRTNTHYSGYVQQLIAGRPVRLSRAQLETLAIVAYRQPITRPEIDEIRGVDSSSTLKVLLDRALIRILGKREEAGRPTLYGTTKEFLDFFSLGDLRELPTLREYSELTAESRKVVSDRLGVGLDGAPAAEAAPGEAGEPGEPEVAADEPVAMSSEPEVAADEPMAMSSEPEVAADEPMAMSGESHVEAHEAVELSESHVEAHEAVEVSGESHVEAHEAVEVSESHVEAHEAVEVSGESHVDSETAAEIPLDSHVGAGESEHDFIDPEELAGRVIAGESDTGAHGDEGASELEAAPSGDAPEHADAAAHRDGADTSAPDDPAVD